MEGRWPEPFEGEDHLFGFFTTYTVVASGLDAAVSAVVELEPDLVQPTLVVHEAAKIEAEDGLPPGVYSISGYAFFDPDAQDE